MARIVIDARESGTSTGRYIDKLVEYLAKLKPDHQVIVLTKSPRLAYIKLIAPNFEAVASDYKEFTFAEQLGLKKQIKSLTPDLVHFGMTQQPILYKGRAVTTIHDLTMLHYRNPYRNWLFFTVRQRLYEWVKKSAAQKSTRVLVPSKYVKQDLLRLAKIPASKVVVTYEAADKIMAAAEPVKALVGKQFLLYVGRAAAHKNLVRLAEAFIILKQTRPGLQLVLAGRLDEHTRGLKKQLARLGIEDIVFTDFVTDGQLRWLYESTAAYIFPSLSEGFGLPGLEAMIHDAPVASSSATCLPEIYGPAAHYFDPLDVGDIAAKIDELLSDNKLRAKLIAAGHKQAGKYSWAKMAEQTLAIYNQALKS